MHFCFFVSENREKKSERERERESKKKKEKNTEKKKAGDGLGGMHQIGYFFFRFSLRSTVHKKLNQTPTKKKRKKKDGRPRPCL
jgi:hypothetical protein